MQLIDPASLPRGASSQAHLFVEHLTNIDFSVIHDDGMLTGQSWAVDLVLTGRLNEQGMLLDFGDVKKAIKADIESLWDHKLVVPAQMPGLSLTLEGGDSLLTWSTSSGQTYRHLGPELSLFVIQGATVNKQSLEQQLQQYLAQKWHSDQIQKVQITLRTETSEANIFFQYSHGLRLHKGACQRIAHGHRSKVRVFTEKGFDESLSCALAKQIHNGYFVDRNTIIETTQTRITLGYTAPEGYYQLTIPRHQAIIMDTETTVENIAQHLLHTSENTMITAVQVYEGWQKGAFASR